MACGQVRAHQVVPTRELGPNWVGAIPTWGARGHPRARVRAQTWPGSAAQLRSGTRIFRPPHTPWTLKSFVKNVILFRPFSAQPRMGRKAYPCGAKFRPSGGGVPLEKKRLTISPSLGQGLPDTPARRASRGPCLADRAQTRSVRGHIPPSQGRNFACAGIGFPSSASGPSSGPNAASKQDRPRPGKGSKKAKKMAFFPGLRRKVQG